MNTILHYSLLAFVLLGFLFNTSAQVPTCKYTNGIYYLSGGTAIYNFDVQQPMSASNPVLNTISAPIGSLGLAVSNNINTTGLPYTFYVVANSKYHYYNGSTWINTNHNASSVNIVGGGFYIYGIDPATGNVYRYDGNSDDKLILNLPSGCVYDLAADCSGNFYVLNPVASWMRLYNPSGNLLNTWNTTGTTSNVGGGGLAVVGNKVYFDANYWGNSRYYTGLITGSTVNFTFITPGLSVPPMDFGSCPESPNTPYIDYASIDSGFYCGMGTGISVYGLGSGPHTWSVLSGNATITGSGRLVNIAVTTTSKIQMQAFDSSSCNYNGSDTVTIIPASAIIDAGNHDTAFGCNSITYIDTLKGKLTNASPGIIYNLAWSPISAITNGTNSLTPAVNITSPTYFTLSVTTPQSQGGCLWKDSVLVTPQASNIEAGFTYHIKYGCTEDTVLFNNTTISSAGIPISKWNYSTNTFFETAVNPVHIFKKHGHYNITLQSDNGYCADTITSNITIDHPIKANITIDNEWICENDSFTVDASNSIITLSKPPYKYYWDFGNGHTSQLYYLKHLFPSIPDNGNKIILVVTDTLGCTDTAVTLIRKLVDIPYADVGPLDTIICNNERLNLPLGTVKNAETYNWSNGLTQPTNVVSNPGTYVLTVSNQCGSYTDSIIVYNENCTVWFPSAFTPNGDGRNDFAKLVGNLDAVIQFNLSIYNRWGECIFRTNNKYDGWNGDYKGKEQATGTFYYMYTYTITSGSRFSGKGDLLLLR